MNRTILKVKTTLFKGPHYYSVRKIVGGWVHQNAYNCLFTLHEVRSFWHDFAYNEGGLELEYAYVIKVWPLMNILYF